MVEEAVLFNSYSSDFAEIGRVGPRYIAKLCIFGHSKFLLAVGRLVVRPG